MFVNVVKRPSLIINQLISVATFRGVFMYVKIYVIVLKNKFESSNIEFYRMRRKSINKKWAGKKVTKPSKTVHFISVHFIVANFTYSAFSLSFV